MRIGKVTLWPARPRRPTRHDAPRVRDPYLPPERKGPPPEAPGPPDGGDGGLFGPQDSGEFEPPGQKELMKKCLRPQGRVDIVFLDRDSKKPLEMRASIIHDIDGQGRLILAQTEPPILASRAGEVVELSFLHRYASLPGRGWLRVGYRAAIEKIIPDYKLGPRLKDTVVVVPGPKKLIPANLRLAYRVPPPKDLDIRLELWPQGRTLWPLDFSLSGARFWSGPEQRIDEGEDLDLVLKSGRRMLNLPSKVIRSEKPKGPHSETLISVEFTDISAETARDLKRLLAALQRHLLAQRAGFE